MVSSPGASEQTPQTEPWTVRRLLDWTRGHFAARGIAEPRLAAEILLAEALGCQRIELYTRFDRVPDPAQLDVFRNLVKQAADHAPISYLVGRKEFYSLEFTVGPAVLIPRQETELLVQHGIETVRSSGGEAAVILDIGTGSGCIAIALLKNLPAARAVATDVSADALAIAQCNAEKHDIVERITFVEADRLNLPDDCVPAGGFDLIASNPPYVAAAEMDSLDANVRAYEPARALTDGADGLSFYRVLAEQGADRLAAAGRLLVEVSDGRADAVRQIFAEAGRFEADGSWRDMVAGHERVLRFRPSSRAD